MSYLQNGSCFKNSESAKADFLSRINDFEQRIIVDRQFKSMNEVQVQAFFPDCVTADKMFNDMFMAVLPLVLMCIVFKYVKSVALGS